MGNFYKIYSNINFFGKRIYIFLFISLFFNNVYSQCNVDTLVANFTSTQTCNTKSVHFNDTSIINSGSITTYSWAFGDGNTSLLQNPDHIYASYGNYTVTLTLTHSSGCTSTFSTIIGVTATPDAQFSANPDSVCPAQAIVFNNLSTGVVLINQWFFRDGTGYNDISSTQANPSHNFFTALGNGYQTFNVMLKVIAPNGCFDTISHPIVIKQSPYIDFMETGNFRRCENVVASITDTAEIFNYSDIPNISSYLINWGDGGGLNPIIDPFTSTSSIKHVYYAVGRYPIVIEAIGNNGCSSVFRDTFDIITIPLPEFSSLPYSSGCVPFLVYTINNSTGISPNTLTFIDWGDNIVDTLPLGAQPGDTLWHYYTTTTCILGTQYPFNMQITTQNECGAPYKSYGPISVFAPPEAGVDLVDDSVCVGNPAMFLNLTIPNFCAANPRTLYTWDFGDSTTLSVWATMIDPAPGTSHIYNLPGIYTVILRAENNSLPSTGSPGCGSSDDTILVYVFEAYAEFTHDSVCINDSTQFIDLSTAPSGNISAWNWDFGDGSTSTEQNPKHVFTSQGQYRVTLTVYDFLGCTDSVSHFVDVDSIFLTNFTYSNTCSGDTTFFTNLTISNSDTISLYQWDFGDGSPISNIENPIHIYQNSGIFNVTLAAYNNRGCHKDNTIEIIVHQKPTASFYTDTICSGYQKYFSDNSIAPGGSIISYFWTMGDTIGTCYQSDTTYIYSGNGTYIVNLQIEDENGCRDDTSRSFFLGTLPIADFTFDTVCFLTQTTFTNTSSEQGIPIVSSYWNFNDATTLTLPNISNTTHTFNTFSAFDVLLVVTNANGCIDSVLHTVAFDTLPNPFFSATNVCIGDTTFFTDSSTTSGTTIISRNWDFGDGNSSTDINPYHIYSNSGVYNVVLSITDSKGCVNDTTISANVYAFPSPSFTVSKPCVGQTTNFFPNIGNPLYSEWNWDFGDGGLDTIQNPSHVFSAISSYNVELSVTDIFGCKGDSIITVLISPIPTSNFAFDSSCTGNIFFTDISSTVGSSINKWNWDFGDGGSDSLQNIYHQYPIVTLPTNYNVSFIVIDSLGCRDTSYNQLTIYPSIVVDFISDTVCNNSPIQVTDISYSANSNIISWLWNFGNGNTSNIQNPNYTYTNILDDTTFNVCLIASDERGCTDTTYHPLLVHPQPVVSFRSDTVCLGIPSQFYDLSYSNGGALFTWNWNFGGTGTDTLQNPIHLFINPGTFNTNLIVSDINGCINSNTIPVVVDSVPEIDFSFEQYCISGLVGFNDLTIAHGSPNNERLWDFGDSNFTNLANPIHYFNQIDTFLVTLIVTNDNGCPSVITKSIAIRSPLTIDFFADTVCQGSITNFTDSLLIQSTQIASRSWDFGDGNTSNIHNPQHLYSLAGTYNVSLTVFDTNGCTESINHNIIVKSKPLVNFTNTSSCIGDTTLFTDISNSVSPITSRFWNFSDGNNSTQTNPSHLYNYPGNYLVKLVINSSNGCADSITRTIIVDSLPEVNFTSNLVCRGGQTVFTNTSQDHGSFNNSWIWNFGDGIGTSSLQNPFYTFQNHGVFNVKLVITNQSGCKDSVINQVQVDTIPIVNFNADSACLGISTHFTNTSHWFGNLPITYSWNFGDNTQLSALTSPTHIYSGSGTYQVTLSANDSHGCFSSTTKNIIVYSLPIAGFTSNVVLYPEVTTFTNTSVGTPAIINNWNWNFGDGVGTSNLQNPTYSFIVPNTFNTRLIVTDINGCKDTVINQVTVISPLITANFGYTENCENTFTTFTDSSTVADGNQILGWFWNFGDNSTSVVQNPQHQYVNSGVYNVQLIVYGIANTADTIVKTITIFTKPTANFDNSRVCIGVNKTFTDLSTIQTGNIVGWNWDFGNGNTANTLDHSTVYNSFGNYDVRLIVTTDNGCSDTIIKVIKVSALPLVSFNSDYTEGCTPVFITFTSTSVVDSGFVSSWSWVFGDGNSTIVNTNQTGHTFLSSGSYNVTLTAISNDGCQTTLTIPNMVVVHPNPIANFSLTPSITTILNSNISFFDNSNGAAKWNWYFGDGDSSEVRSPIHNYYRDGTYFPMLIVTSEHGCTDETTMKVIIIKETTFYVPNIFTPNGDGINDYFLPLSIEFIEGEFEMMIFNRWGEMVYNTKDFNKGWNGTINNNGEECYDGVYVWKINFMDALGIFQKKTGRVTLIK